MLRSWFHDGWFLFSALMSVIILVFLALPWVFGFQHFVQWGAMYDDRWCIIQEYEKSPHETQDVRFQTIVPGSDVSRVYSGPTHNRMTCLAQARMRCDRQSKDEWTIVWVEAQFQGVSILGQANVCDLSVPSLDYWFFDEK